LHVSFKMNRDGEQLGLFASDGTTIDAVTYGYQTNDVSMGRYPDGGATIEFMHTPTPRLANIHDQPAEPPTPPELGGVVILPSGLFQFHFTTTVGSQYQIFYKEDLNAPTWNPFGPPQTAASTVVTITSPMGVPQRFYQVVISP
jgi:hypothetical protein